MAEPSSSPTQTTTTATAATTTTTTTSLPWGTREEFLLACAVQRYGTDAWDSISRELQIRTAFSLVTPHLCQQKYRDLKTRFASDAGEISDDGAGLSIDELRRLHLAELRRDLQRYDLSIVSLQLKVKKLEGESNNAKEEIKEEKSDLQKNEEKETEINEVKIEPVDGSKPEPVEPDVNEPDRKDEPERGEEDYSCNGSSNSKEERGGEKERRERVESEELVESVAESKDDVGSGGGEGEDGVKESSDVQSTASLWRSENNNKNNINRREIKVGVLSGTSSGEENQSPALKSNNDGKQPLVEFLDTVRARKLGSFFERRLESQESPRYKTLIKQHIDLETIQRRMEEGQYTDCQTKFYRDLMLLINNAIVFFTKRSSEYKAALELRQLLNKQFQSHVPSPHDHKSRPSKPAQPPPLPKPTKPEVNQADLKEPPLIIKVPVNACRKRSSIAGKSSRGGSEKKEPALAMAIPPDEKPASLGEIIKQQRDKTASTSFHAVTKKRTRDQSFGSRSSPSKNSNSYRSPSTPMPSKRETSDKKKPSPDNSSNKIKHVSGSGKDLLLHSLKNSDKRKTGSGSGSGNGNGNGGSSGNVKSDRRKDEGPLNGSGSKLGKEKTKVKEERENENSGNRSTRRPPKRQAAIAAMGKRGRDGGGEAESQSKKRQRK
ncbi:hypothetical protein SOVF_053670 [Spinacia oleracea]|nr:hypothetical protein SOVF_053670 [Spinacia oleracea]